MSDPEDMNTLIDAEATYPEQPIVRYSTWDILDETLELSPALRAWVGEMEALDGQAPTATEAMLVNALVRQQNRLVGLVQTLLAARSHATYDDPDGPPISFVSLTEFETERLLRQEDGR